MMVTKINQFPEGNLQSRLKANWPALTLAAIGFLPLLWNFFVLSWNRPAYQFFPMAIIAAGILAWRAAEQTSAVLDAGNLWVLRCLALATGAMLLMANYLWSPWLAYIAFLLCLATAVWGLGGKTLMSAYLPVGLVLLTILPPPWAGDEKLTVWLRGIATDYSSVLLDWLRVTHVQDGNTIQLPGRSLFMEEACSGINSFVLCNAFCLFWLLWKQRPLWWLCFALPATSIFVVLGNIFRITTCGAADYFWHFDLLNGWRHETFGLVLLLGYCGLIISLDFWLSFLFITRRSSPAPAAKSPPEPKLDVQAKNPNRPAAPVFGFPFVGAFLALVGAGVFVIHEIRSGGHGLASVSIFKSPLELKFSLPPTLDGWQRLSENSGKSGLLQTWGFHTTSWDYMRDGITLTIAVDYPLDGFHDVKGCYILSGWKVKRETEGLGGQDHSDLHLIRLDLESGFRHAVVFHSVVGEQGNWLTRESVKAFANSLPPTGYRIQMVTGGNGLGYAPSSPQFEEEALAFFLQARQLLVAQLVDQFHKASH